MAQQRSRRKSSGGISRKSRSPVDHHEVEWQFDAGELEPVEAWLRHHSSGAGLVVKPEPEEKIADAYYDSQDWRFYRAGYALRVRKAGTDTEATMKSLSPAEGNVRRRREITEPRKDDKSAAPGKASGPVGERAPDGEPAGGPSDPGVTGTRWYQPEGQRPGPRRGSARRRVASRQGP